MWIRLKPYILLLLLGITNPVCQANNVSEQHLKVVLRMVGHQFLLQTGDSTSRVLPIKKADGRYVIQFEKEMEIEPDLLSFSVSNVFEENDIKSGYIVEVESCESPEVVYSFEYDPSKETDLIPCKLRPLPTDCYRFFVTILNEASVAATPPQTQAGNSKFIIYLFIVIAFIGGLMVYYRKKMKTGGSFDESDLIAVGNYQFDKNGMKLIFNGQSEKLSSKETDLLELLAANENQTLEREYILNVVWNDEGDYIGRTLDVSISKLRKKLKSDPNLKIINIRGVGYRFAVS